MNACVCERGGKGGEGGREGRKKEDGGREENCLQVMRVLEEQKEHGTRAKSGNTFLPLCHRQ